MPIVTALLLLLALCLGVCWWLQARRDRRLLRERTHIVVGSLVKLVAGHYHKWAPNLARLLAEKHWGLLRVSEGTLLEPHLAAALEALEVHFDLTFDGERFHAKGPPRQQKEETDEPVSDDPRR